ncbi:NUDIX hydrolase [Paenibacillus sp. WLX2291]|uniref:NUDIX hydrolase n=1 Tax=Paenibacillus sp. WLX2291 TaxID=3296934 RepID=UPI003983DD27
MIRVNVVYSLITNSTQSKVLAVCNIDPAGNRWSLPGGAVEKNESLDQAAIREAKEETGLDIKVDGIVAIQERVFLEKQEHALFITFKGKVVGGNEELVRADEIAEIAWLDIEQAEELMPYYENGLRKLIMGEGIPYCNQGRN